MQLITCLLLNMQLVVSVVEYELIVSLVDCAVNRVSLFEYAIIHSCLVNIHLMICVLFNIQ
jgi:hypothetical protein